jgi:hypothetical protein
MTKNSLIHTVCTVYRERYERQQEALRVRRIEQQRRERVVAIQQTYDDYAEVILAPIIFIPPILLLVLGIVGLAYFSGVTISVVPACAREELLIPLIYGISGLYILNGILLGLFVLWAVWLGQSSRFYLPATSEMFVLCNSLGLFVSIGMVTLGAFIVQISLQCESNPSLRALTYPFGCVSLAWAVLQLVLCLLGVWLGWEEAYYRTWHFRQLCFRCC